MDQERYKDGAGVTPFSCMVSLLFCAAILFATLFGAFSLVRHLAEPDAVEAEDGP
jgi:hypothetical protein